MWHINMVLYANPHYSAHLQNNYLIYILYLFTNLNMKYISKDLVSSEEIFQNQIKFYISILSANFNGIYFVFSLMWNGNQKKN